MKTGAEPPGIVALASAASHRPSRPEVEESRLQPLSLETRHLVLLRLADAAALALSAVLGAAALGVIDATRVDEVGVRHIVMTALALAVALHFHGLYRRPASRLRPSAWWRPNAIARCVPTAALLTLGASAVLPFLPRLSLSAAVAMTLPALLFVPMMRRAVVRLFGPPSITRILIVGTGQVADRLVARLGRCYDTVVVGQVDNEPTPGSSVLGGLDDLRELCRKYRIDRVIVAFSMTSAHETLEKLRGLGGRVPISIVPRLFELHSWRSEVEELHGMPLLHVPPGTLSLSARLLKRSIDLVVAALAIIVALPLWLAVAAAIKLESPGPVFFRQERTGRGGTPFRIFKFRTMSADASERQNSIVEANEVDGPLFKIRNDPRVTRVGRILRRTSIDELPQLINVVRGEMSLVGPRPLPTAESDRIDGAALTRFDVRPGMTGLWQVSGRSDLSYADLQHLDSVYVGSWSLMWDLRIMWATPRSVFARRGAY
jgi:exopolysaccharide biosynthesis polyprenyl glycosylphosphotransferase